MDRAREKDVMVYAIGLETEYFNGQQRVRSSPDRGLKKLAEDTGGGYFELKKTADLGETFTRVAQELHSQYVLGFSPETLDGKIHKLDVRVKKAGMNARARKTYMAPLARHASQTGVLHEREENRHREQKRDELVPRCSRCPNRCTACPCASFHRVRRTTPPESV